ncbi:MAG: nucleotidyltransferase family protein [bacterium]|nr:nucleotidyltransferase family protein [bacterium]
MMNKELVKENLFECKKLLKRYGVKKIGVFGSLVRGERKEDSDIDLLVEVKDIRLLDFVELEMKLSEMLGAKVDLVSIKALKPFIKPYIMKEVEFIEGL